MIKIGITKDVRCMQFIDPFFKNDCNFFLEMLPFNPSIIDYACPKIKQDEKVMNKAIELNPRSFKMASFSLKNNKEFAIKSIKLDIDNFEYLEDLKFDDSFLIEISAQIPRVTQYFREKLEDTEFVQVLL